MRSSRHSCASLAFSYKWEQDWRMNNCSNCTRMSRLEQCNVCCSTMPFVFLKQAWPLLKEMEATLEIDSFLIVFSEYFFSCNPWFLIKKCSVYITSGYWYFIQIEICCIVLMILLNRFLSVLLKDCLIGTGQRFWKIKP